MPDLKPPPAEGVLRDGWTKEVSDYVLACEWALGGKALIIGDAIGGLFAYDGKSGERIWGLSDQHNGGLLRLKFIPKENSSLRRVRMEEFSYSRPATERS